MSSFNIKELCNKDQGDSCYLFGDGISIKWFDLTRFSNRPSILIGFLWFHNNIKSLNISVGSLIEPFYFYPISRYPANSGNIIRNQIQKDYKEIIKKYNNHKFLINVNNYPATWYLENINYINQRFTFGDKKGHLLFDNFNCFKGSFRFGIALAIYMGFKNIYLVGFDYTHSPARILHWYEKGTGLINQNDDYDKNFILTARKYVNIITITLDGKSKHMDYITYKDFTGEDPIYSENTEIISPENLKTLSSWPGYTIY